MKPIQVGGSHRHPLIEGPLVFALLLLILFGLIAGLVSTFPGIEPKHWLRLGLAILVIEAPFLLLVSLVAFIQWRRRLWLETTPHGFVLRGAKGEQEYSIDSVKGITYSTKQKRSLGGLFQKTRCSVVVEENAETKRVYLSWEYPGTEPDPLKSLIDRIGLRLKETAVYRLEHGGTIRGQDWELNSAGLSVLRGDGETLAYDQLATVALYGGKLRIWRRGRDEPVFAVGADSPNVQTLRRVLLERVQSRPEEPSGNMGLLLFEDKPGVAGPLWVFCAGLFLLLFFISVTLLSKGVWIGSGVFLLIAVACLGPAWNIQRRLFRCYEHGLVARNGLGTRQLRFRELADCSFEMRAPNLTGPGSTPLGFFLSFLFLAFMFLGRCLRLLLTRSPKSGSSEFTPLGRRRRLLLSLVSPGLPLPPDFREFVTKYQSAVSSCSAYLRVYFRDQDARNQLEWETDMTLNTVPLLRFISRITDFISAPLDSDARIIPQQLEEGYDLLASRPRVDSLTTEGAASLS
jgi:hypothetical protein